MKRHKLMGRIKDACNSGELSNRVFLDASIHDILFLATKQTAREREQENLFDLVREMSAADYERWAKPTIKQIMKRARKDADYEAG